jgi:hypothetical protein
MIPKYGEPVDNCNFYIYLHCGQVSELYNYPNIHFKYVQLNVNDSSKMLLKLIELYTKLV